MIGWADIYKVVVAMVPLYVALMLGYGSVRWWKVFTPEQCGAINRFVCYFTLPFFTFEFTAHVDPFKMNYLFIGADAISKLIIVTVGVKLARNPNSYACIIGLVWAFIANRSVAFRDAEHNGRFYIDHVENWHRNCHV
ncbi:hypothetical protein H0E87_030789 [Populus deltoides]|uniref:Auxin efflux carrier family protein n=1 Tax=Populus deltoides TaxID=3696 RepID=A0A8T2WJB3_POPDE|nr:hypothetical protein H0E87_030789 [Populus deltoides]